MQRYFPSSCSPSLVIYSRLAACRAVVHFAVVLYLSRFVIISFSRCLGLSADNPRFVRTTLYDTSTAIVMTQCCFLRTSLPFNLSVLVVLCFVLSFMLVLFTDRQRWTNCRARFVLNHLMKVGNVSQWCFKLADIAFVIWMYQN